MIGSQCKMPVFAPDGVKSLTVKALEGAKRGARTEVLRCRNPNDSKG